MNKKKFQYILSWAMYFLGFIGYIAFLSAIHDIDETAWLYAIGASVGVFLFTASEYLRR